MTAPSARLRASFTTLTAILSGLLLLSAPAAQAAPFAYITNDNSDNVSVIDTASNTVTATVGVGDGPFGVAVTPDGTRVYVANYGGGTVSVIRTSDNTVTATVGVGSGPVGVAVTPDGARVYVANFGGNTVSVIDTSDNTVTTVGVGAQPHGVAVTPDGARVYVANYGGNTVSVIRTSDNTVTTVGAVGANPWGVAVTPDGARVYVTNIGGNTVSVIDTASNAVTSVVVGATPRGVAITPNGARVYVANLGGTVSVIDTSDNTVATVGVGAEPLGVAVTPDGTRVYVANRNSGNVSVIRTSDNTVTTTVALGTTPAAFGLFITQGAAGLNDTGQTLCYDGDGATVSCTVAPAVDDGRYGRDAAATAAALTKIGAGAAGFDFTKIANNGGVLAAGAVLGTGATDWACTRDNVTELTWEVKVPGAGFRGESEGFSWYNSNGAANGGNAGTDDEGACSSDGPNGLNQCDTEKYVENVNAAVLCGYTDWRLPSRRELRTIVHHGVSNPSIDTTYFPNTVASNFWSASTYVPNPASAWYVNFNDGFANAFSKTSTRDARLVRGGQF